MNDSSYLLASVAVLVALLSLWAQGWVNFAVAKEPYKKKSTTAEEARKKASATLGLFWIYIAVFFAMVGIGLLLVEDLVGLSICTSQIAMGCIITSFLMGLANIVESIVSTFRKVKRGKTIFDTLFKEEEVRKRWLVCIIVIAISLFLVSLFWVSCRGWIWLGYLLIVVAAICKYCKLTREKRNDKRGYLLIVVAAICKYCKLTREKRNDKK